MTNARDPSKPKVCSCCGVLKSPSDFHLQKGKLRSRCRSCCAMDRKKSWDRELANAASWRDRNRDRVNETSRAFNERNREKRNAASREYVLRNKERLIEYNRKWAKKNEDLLRAKASRRRASELRATPKWDDELTRFVTKEAADLAIKRAKLFGFDWHIDHIIPLQSPLVCGFHVWSNLQVIPAVINMRKRNKLTPDADKRSWL